MENVFDTARNVSKEELESNSKKNIDTIINRYESLKASDILELQDKINKLQFEIAELQQKTNLMNLVEPSVSPKNFFCCDI